MAAASTTTTAAHGVRRPANSFSICELFKAFALNVRVSFSDNLTDNFFVFGGHKSDFQGHNKLSFGNVNAYPGVYGPRCVMLQALPQVLPHCRYCVDTEFVPCPD